MFHFKREKVRVLESEEEKKRRRREEEEKKRRKRRSTSFRRGISSGVIPIKVCEFFVWVDPFPHTPSSFYDLRKDWICC